MERTKVTSANIKEVGWENNTLYITFIKGDRTYSYANVSKSAYEALIGSSSVGGYFHSDIKPFYVATPVSFMPT